MNIKSMFSVLLLLCSSTVFAVGGADSTQIGGEAGTGKSFDTTHGGSRLATDVFDRVVYKCPANSTWNGKACVCQAGANYSGTSCVICPSNQIWDGSACSCPPSLPDWSSAYQICEICTYGATGPDGTYWASIKKCSVSGATCPSGTSWNGSSCACNSGTSWDTIASSCMTNCVNTHQTSTNMSFCPAPQVGTITNRQNYTCYNATRGTWGAWYISRNTCANPCTPTNQRQTISCNAGYTGSITQQRDYTCPAAAWGSWYNISNTCTAIPTAPVVTPTPGPTPPASCYWGGGTVSWGRGCSGYAGATTVAHGSSASVGNTAGGYTGSATFTCNNGSFSQSGFCF